MIAIIVWEFESRNCKLCSNKLIQELHFCGFFLCVCCFLNEIQFISKTGAQPMTEPKLDACIVTCILYMCSITHVSANVHTLCRFSQPSHKPKYYRYELLIQGSDPALVPKPCMPAHSESNRVLLKHGGVCPCPHPTHTVYAAKLGVTCLGRRLAARLARADNDGNSNTRQ